jgi:hypothetical protein
VPFFAAGISSVMHPKNPHCPTMHFNYRWAIYSHIYSRFVSAALFRNPLDCLLVLSSLCALLSPQCNHCVNTLLL